MSFYINFPKLFFGLIQYKDYILNLDIYEIINLIMYYYLITFGLALCICLKLGFRFIVKETLIKSCMPIFKTNLAKGITYFMNKSSKLSSIFNSSNFNTEIRNRVVVVQSNVGKGGLFGALCCFGISKKNTRPQNINLDKLEGPRLENGIPLNSLREGGPIPLPSGKYPKNGLDISLRSSDGTSGSIPIGLYPINENMVTPPRNTIRAVSLSPSPESTTPKPVSR